MFCFYQIYCDVAVVGVAVVFTCVVARWGVNFVVWII